MKVKVYLRIGHDVKSRHNYVEANVKPNSRPLQNHRKLPIPTVAFALMLDVPNAMFVQAEQVIAEITIPQSAANIAAEVVMTDPAEE